MLEGIKTQDACEKWRIQMSSGNILLGECNDGHFPHSILVMYSYLWTTTALVFCQAVLFPLLQSLIDILWSCVKSVVSERKLSAVNLFIERLWQDSAFRCKTLIFFLLTNRLTKIKLAGFPGIATDLFDWLVLMLWNLELHSVIQTKEHLLFLLSIQKA